MVDGGIKIEVRPDPHAAGNLAGQSLQEKFSARVQELGSSIADIANTVRQNIEGGIAHDSQSEWGLDTISLKFSIDLEAQAGVLIARAGTRAGFEVEFTWKHDG